MTCDLIKLDFARSKEKNCGPSYTHDELGVSSYKSLGEAKQYCAKDGNCYTILDEFCDNKEFKLCRVGTIEHSDVGSCIYTRSNS